MLLRFDPFRELDRVAQEAFAGPRRPSIPMDAWRHGDVMNVALDLPGVDPGSIDVTVEKNVLTVRAERSWRPSEGDEVVVYERAQGEFLRQLLLGDALDPDRVEAHYRDGVLMLTVPIADQARARKIEVVAAEAPAQSAIAADSKPTGSRAA
ncbi:MAG TPA: Hsp20/alpha crystallin family protein [Acidimicrobiales bacterium]|nr:Hsp20/alpha crystallin family protein [Acidimicrobiales bacterium]